MTYLERLRALARSWNGDIVEVSLAEYGQLAADHRPKYGRRRLSRERVFFDAPFINRSKGIELGIHWPDRKVYFSGPVHWEHVIHEMGHVFAVAKNPDLTDEYSFLGWEYSLVRRIRASIREWVSVKAGYVLEEDAEAPTLGQLSDRERGRLWKDRVAFARQAGMLDAKDNPVCVR